MSHSSKSNIDEQSELFEAYKMECRGYAILWSLAFSTVWVWLFSPNTDLTRVLTMGLGIATLIVGYIVIWKSPYKEALQRRSNASKAS